MRWFLALAWLAASAWTPAWSQESKTPNPTPKETGKETGSKEFSGPPIERWIKEISSKDPGRRTLAIQAIQLYPPADASTALPAIIAELKRHTVTNAIDISVRANGAHALGFILATDPNVDPKLEQEAITILTRFLKDTQVAIRFRAAHALSRIGSRAKPAMNDLIPLLKEATAYEVRLAAVQVLSNIGSDSQGANANVVNGLHPLLHDPSQQVRLASIQAFTLLGPTNDAVVQGTVLKTLLGLTTKDGDAITKIWAHMAIMSLTNKIDPEHVTPIARMAKNEDPQVRAQALQALGTVGTQSKTTFPTLFASLDDPEPAVVAAGMLALARLEKAAAGAVPRLEAIASDPKAIEPIKKLAKDTVDVIQGRKK